MRTSFSNKPGCSSIDSVTIRVYPNPVINFITPEICLNDAIAQFTNNTFTSDSTTLPFLYQWNFGDSNAGLGIPNTYAAQDPAHHYSAASNYLITLKVTNNEECADSLSKIFTVNGDVPEVAFSLTDPAGLCSNDPVNLTNQSSVDFGTITKLLLYWGDTATVPYIDDQSFPGKVYAHNYPFPFLQQLPVTQSE